MFSSCLLNKDTSLLKPKTYMILLTVALPPREGRTDIPPVLRWHGNKPIKLLRVATWCPISNLHEVTEKTGKSFHLSN